MGCCRLYTSNQAVSFILLHKPLLKHHGTISALVMVWCRCPIFVWVLALNLLCLFSSCCLSVLCSCAVRTGLHRATTGVLVHQLLIKFELKILFPLG